MSAAAQKAQAVPGGEFAFTWDDFHFIARLVREEAGIVLGETYPVPIVDHAAARAATLDRYAVTKAHRTSGAEAAALSKASADD